MAEMDYNRLKDVVECIYMDEETCKRIAENCGREKKKSRNYRMRKALLIVAAAVFWMLAAAAVIERMNRHDPGIAVYAAAKDENEWIRLEEGRKKQLQPVLLGEDWYYIFQVELPENYLYEREGVVIGSDFVRSKGNTLYWRIEEEEGEYELPSHMAGTLRIRILDDRGNRVNIILLELSKEDGQCYAEMKYE